MKKILSAIFTLAAVCGAFTNASAQHLKMRLTSTNDTEPYVVLNKTVTEPTTPGGYYWLNLDSYTTGTSTTTTTETHAPIDVVLVLDNSHSMNTAINFPVGTYISVAKGTTLAVDTEYKAKINGEDVIIKGFPHEDSETYTARESRSYSYNTYNNYGTTYYYKYENNYYAVRSGGGKNNRTLSFEVGDTTWYLNGTNIQTNPPVGKKNGDTIWTGILYERSATTRNYYRYGTTAPTAYNTGNELYTGTSTFVYGTTTPVAGVTSLTDVKSRVTSASRLVVLKESVYAFLDILEADSIKYGVDHHIGIALFGGHGNQHSTLTGFTNDYSDLHTKVESIPLPPSSGTPSHLGMQEGLDILNSAAARTSSDVNKVVVFFTDGDPYWETDTQFGAHSSAWVGTQTINIAHEIKGKGATIFSVGLFGSGTPGSTTNYFMNNVSSNYDVTVTVSENWPAINTSNGGEAPHDKYQTSDGTNLQSIFEAIAHTTASGSASISLTADTATSIDMLTADFTLPDGVDYNMIETYVLPYVSGTSTSGTNKYTFAEHSDDYRVYLTSERIQVDPVTNKISVSGFNYSKDDEWNDNGTIKVQGNWVGPRNRTGSETPQYWGKMFRIRIPILPSEDNRGGYTIPTNTANSGIAATISEEDYNKLPDDVKENFKEDQGSNPKTYSGTIATYTPPTTDIPAIAIAKNGLKKGESAHFQVYESDATGTAVSGATVYNVIITGSDAAWDYVILKNYSNNKFYTVKEMSWSWAYTPSNPSSGSLTQKLNKDNAVASMNPSYGIDPGTYLVFPFTNGEKTDNPDHAESVVKNDFSKQGASTTAGIKGTTTNSKN